MDRVTEGQIDERIKVQRERRPPVWTLGGIDGQMPRRMEWQIWQAGRGHHTTTKGGKNDE